MIPLPPPDRALPGLESAFDGDLLAELLDVHLPDRADGRFAITGCRPHYVRYKPETSCLVQHELSLLDRETNQEMTVPAHVRLFADDRGARQWESGSFRRLIERADHHHAGFPRDRVTYLPAMRALVQVFPVDHDLPALTRVTSPSKLRRVLAEVLSEKHGLPRNEPPALVRYKPGRKALLCVRLEDGEAGAFYAKLLTDDRGATLRDAGIVLRHAGVATPESLLYHSPYRMLVHAAAPGEQLATLRGTPAYAAWMEPAADILSRFHATTVPGLTEHTLAAETSILEAAATAIARLLPPLAPRVDGLLAGLSGRLAAIPDRLETNHGDFYDDQLLVGSGQAVLIDLDEARSAHPLLDVGNMLAHLTVAAERGELPPGAGDGFRDAYLRQQPARRDEIAVFEAAALLKLAIGPFRRLEPDWPIEVVNILRLAEDRLSGARSPRAVPATNGRQSGIADPALPQLTTLTDPRRMAVELERAVYGRLVAVDRIEVIRHKPGRRAILRYEIEVNGHGGPGRERLYGKTFASERGPRTFRTTAALAAARACGQEVQLPAPVGFLSHLKLMLLREVPGVPVTAALRGGDEQLAARIATALHRLHSSGVDLERIHDVARELAPLPNRVQRLAVTDPSLAAPARRCLALVERGRDRPWQWRSRPIHRDFYHDQLLIDGDRLALLDLDDAALAEPAVDVANFIAHLRLLALQQEDDAEALAPVAAAFSRSYRGLDPDLDPLLTRFLEGATLLRLADIHAPRRHGRRIAAELLRLGEHELERALGAPPAPRAFFASEAQAFPQPVGAA